MLAREFCVVNEEFSYLRCLTKTLPGYYELDPGYLYRKQKETKTWKNFLTAQFPTHLLHIPSTLKS